MRGKISYSNQTSDTSPNCITHNQKVEHHWYGRKRELRMIREVEEDQRMDQRRLRKELRGSDWRRKLGTSSVIRIKVRKKLETNTTEQTITQERSEQKKTDSIFIQNRIKIHHTDEFHKNCSHPLSPFCPIHNRDAHGSESPHTPHNKPTTLCAASAKIKISVQGKLAIRLRERGAEDDRHRPNATCRVHEEIAGQCDQRHSQTPWLVEGECQGECRVARCVRKFLTLVLAWLSPIFSPRTNKTYTNTITITITHTITHTHASAPPLVSSHTNMYIHTHTYVITYTQITTHYPSHHQLH